MPNGSITASRFCEVTAENGPKQDQCFMLNPC